MNYVILESYIKKLVTNYIMEIYELDQPLY